MIDKNYFKEIFTFFTKNLFFFLYGTIYSFSVSNWHETVHRTAFRSRWLNDFFYHISSFMCDFEGFRWRWSHTFHHTYTLQTQDDYDSDNLNVAWNKFNKLNFFKLFTVWGHFFFNKPNMLFKNWVIFFHPKFF